MSSYLKFLGTAGARFVVAQQLRSSGGTWLSAEGTNLYLDPGPGALVKCLTSRPKLDPAALDGIILSHNHIDHSNDVNIMIEAMTHGGYKRKGILLTTRQSMEEDAVVRSYVCRYLEAVEMLEAGKPVRIGNISVLPVRHQHASETYGLRFVLRGITVSFVTDTLFFPELASRYAGSDIMVLNVVRVQGTRDDEIQHLCLEDARILIRDVRPRIAVLTHFGSTMLRAKPWLLTQQLQEETGVQVIAARDGMSLEINGQ